MLGYPGPPTKRPTGPKKFRERLGSGFESERPRAGSARTHNSAHTLYRGTLSTHSFAENGGAPQGIWEKRAG